MYQRDWDDAHLTNRLVDAHADDPAFGYRLLSDEVNVSGRVASENRIDRLCRAQKLASTTVRRRRGKGRPGPGVADRSLTEHPAAEGKVYICAVKDVCLRCIKDVGQVLGA